MANTNCKITLGGITQAKFTEGKINQNKNTHGNKYGIKTQETALKD